jgi:putative flippase GtrA
MALTRTELALRYGAFAVIATLANLSAQRLVLAIPGGGFLPALMAGTGVGLIVKYLLDKRWIFHDAFRHAREETRRFSLYTMTGIATTALFWITETAFWAIGQTQAAREAGAVLGLALGYTIKYRLDRRFVFRDPPGGG